MQDTFHRKKLEFSALGAEYYCLTNERHRNPYITESEQGTNRGQALDYCGGFFQRFQYDWGDDHGLTSCLHSSSCSSHSFLIEFRWFRDPLVLTLDVFPTST